MVVTINQLLENKKAHSECHCIGKEIHYLGKKYSFKEFDKAFPINFERVLLGNFRKYKGENKDKTKIEK